MQISDEDICRMFESIWALLLLQYGLETRTIPMQISDEANKANAISSRIFATESKPSILLFSSTSSATQQGDWKIAHCADISKQALTDLLDRCLKEFLAAICDSLQNICSALQYICSALQYICSAKQNHSWMSSWSGRSAMQHLHSVLELILQLLLLPAASCSINTKYHRSGMTNVKIKFTPNILQIFHKYFIWIYFSF